MGKQFLHNFLYNWKCGTVENNDTLLQTLFLIEDCNLL